MNGRKCCLVILAILMATGFAGGEPRRCKHDAAPVKAVYSVADLVMPIIDYPPPSACDLDVHFDNAAEPAPNTNCYRGTASIKKNTIEDQLIRLIQATVAPNSWQDVGGLGTIQYEPVKMSLVVTQSVAVHEQIGELLAALRRLQDVEVAVELRILKVTELTSGLLSFSNEIDWHKLSTGNTLMLDTDQVKRMLTFVEQDKHSEIMQSPRITVFNGQLACINVEDQLCCLNDVQVEKHDGKFVIVPKYEFLPIGMTCNVRPVVSADRKTVDLSLKFRLATPDSLKRTPAQLFLTKEEAFTGLPAPPRRSPSGELLPLPRDQEVPLPCAPRKPNVTLLKLDRLLKAIPAGQTALMYVGTATEEFHDEHRVPALSDIPLLGQFFRSVEEGRHTRQVLLMLTPRIIIQPEEEIIFKGELPPIPRP
jgi:general secretion pathway protein D